MSKVVSQSRFIKEALDAHNKYRSIHGVPNLELDPNLSNLALDWAEQIASEGTLKYRNEVYLDEFMGENIMRYTLNPSKPIYYSGSEATDEWYKQESNYKYDETFSPDVGNFTQIVWKNTKRVGFGFAISENGKFYVVANYYPAGNFKGKFKENVFPPGTKSTQLRVEKSEFMTEFPNSSQNKDTRVNPAAMNNRRDPEPIKSSNSYPKPAVDNLQFGSIQSRFINEALLKHNECRRTHGVGPLVHNPEISKIAQKYADSLAKAKVLRHSTNTYNDERLGENLAFFYDSRMDYYSGDAATLQWYDEIKMHNFNRDHQSGTGHFTQVVWKGSKEVGFGLSKAADGSFYVVGNYYPAGNMIGSFAKNVPAPL